MSWPEEAWVTVARLGKARGIRGEITALPLSDRPERFESLGQVYLCGTGAPVPRQVERTWFHNRTLIFKFEGVDTMSDAELLSGMEVRVPFAEDWQDGGGGGLLVVTGGMMIPFARAICVEIDVARRRIAVDLPEGLRELTQS